MKLGTCMVLGAIGATSLGSVASLALQGCSSSSSTTTTSSSGGGVAPPSSPTTGTSAATTTETTFAVKTIHLGDESGTEGWKYIGYDIDGQNFQTVASRTASACKPISGGANGKLLNGNNGIDNSFGENITPLLSQFATSASLSGKIDSGTFTVIVDTTGLSSSATQSSTGLSGGIYFGLAFAQGPNASGSTPTFSGSDNWPVASLTPSTTFSSSWVNNGTFVSGARTSASIALTISGVQLTIPINVAVLTFEHSGSSATNGIISGVIDAQDLVNQLKGVAGNISSSLCSGSAFNTIQTAILAAADIMDDGTQNPSENCQGISIGLGFEAATILKPSFVGTPTTGSNPCDDAGTSTGGEDAGTD